MKKIIFYVFVFSLIVTGCTSKEQDEKIRAYWADQLASIPAVNFQKGSSGEKDLAATQESTPGQEGTDASALPADGTPSVKAFLFLSPTCPWCKKLKQDGWPEQFRQKYQGQVELVVYELNNDKNEQILIGFMQKRHMTRIGYPVLFVGDEVFQGYPLADRADATIQKELAKQSSADNSAKETNAASTGKSTQGAKTAANKSAQQPYMKIVMEEPVKETVNTKASAKDRKAMDAAFAQVQTDNKKTLSDIEMMFGASTRAQAVSIINENERLLKNKMGTSTTYKAYLAAQSRILKTQEQQLNELMQRNARNIRSI